MADWGAEIGNQIDMSEESTVLRKPNFSQMDDLELVTAVLRLRMPLDAATEIAARLSSSYGDLKSILYNSLLPQVRCSESENSGGLDMMKTLANASSRLGQISAAKSNHGNAHSSGALITFEIVEKAVDLGVNARPQELRQLAGRWLRSLREAKAMSQQQLAITLGMQCYTVVSQIEQGVGKIPWARAGDWASALDVPPHQFALALIAFYEPYAAMMLTRQGKHRSTCLTVPAKLVRKSS